MRMARRWRSALPARSGMEEATVGGDGAGGGSGRRQWAVAVGSPAGASSQQPAADANARCSAGLAARRQSSAAQPRCACVHEHAAESCRGEQGTCGDSAASRGRTTASDDTMVSEMADSATFSVHRIAEKHCEHCEHAHGAISR